MMKTFLVLLCVFLPWCSAQACGGRRVKRVVSGTEATPHSWPWQALIERKGKAPDRIGFGQHCGGTLIDKQWIVTAAHCLFSKTDPSLYRVKLGVHDRSKKELLTQTFGVDKMILHRRFLTDKGYGYDIALIKLSRPAVLGYGVGMACLPIQYDRIAIGSTCYLSGWGSTTFGGPKAITLQQTPLPIVGLQKCQAGNSWFQPVDDKSMICAGFGGNTTISGCNGDSGGPLICSENSKWVLRGAVSWGDPKCRAGTTYSVFARISSFVSWIKTHINANPSAELAQPDGDTCSDYHYYCSVWKSQGRCQHPYFKQALEKYCPFSCEYCTLEIQARSTDVLQDFE